MVTTPRQSQRGQATKEYKSDLQPIWCAGCGDYAVLGALYQALSELKVPNADLVLVSGIGCSGRLPGFVRSFGFHGVHGRALPLATGVKLGQPELTVIAVGGDGDGLAIGGGHLPHAARRNIDITYIMMDNSIYAQTKGQSSPTSPWEMSTKSEPYGTMEDQLNATALALAYDASFVAQGFAGKMRELQELIRRGIQHRGFSFIHIISPCATFNNTFHTFSQLVEEIPADHDTADKSAAFRLALRTLPVATGVLYEVDKPTFQERLITIRGRAQDRGPTNLDALLDLFT